MVNLIAAPGERCKQLAYEDVLKAAKESSVPIQDQERAKKLIGEQIASLNPGAAGQTFIQPGAIYGPFTVEYRIEMDVCHADKETGGCDSRECCLRSAIAILYDDTPEKEPQEDNGVEALRKELEEYTKAYNQECERNDAIRKDLEYWAQKAADLLKFKQYVHDRLDKMGIPADPEPQNNAAHGCRIEGRLNVVERLMGNNIA